MWYFLVKQSNLNTAQYQALQKQASLTEVETFNEPYDSWYIFSVEKESYTEFMDHLDREGVPYELTADRPTRAEMISGMQ